MTDSPVSINVTAAVDAAEIVRSAGLASSRPKRSSQPQLSDLRDQWRFHSFSAMSNVPVSSVSFVSAEPSAQGSAASTSTTKSSKQFKNSKKKEAKKTEKKKKKKTLLLHKSNASKLSASNPNNNDNNNVNDDDVSSVSSVSSTSSSSSENSSGCSNGNADNSKPIKRSLPNEEAEAKAAAAAATARSQFIHAKPPSRPPSKRFCVRDGCSNLSIDDPQWDGEYCSTECCLIHVGDVRQLYAALSQSD